MQMQSERAAAYYQSTTASGPKSAQGFSVVPREARESARPAHHGGRRSVDVRQAGGTGWRKPSVVAANLYGLAGLQGFCGGRRSSTKGRESEGRKLSAVQSSRSTMGSRPSTGPSASRHGSVVSPGSMSRLQQGSPGPSEPYRRDSSPPPAPSDAYLAASYMGGEDVIRRRPTCTASPYTSYGGDEDVISVTSLDKGRAEREGGDPEPAELSRFGEDLPTPLTELSLIAEDVQAELSRIGEDSEPKQSAAASIMAMGKRSIANARFPTPP